MVSFVRACRATRFPDPVTIPCAAVRLKERRFPPADRFTPVEEQLAVGVEDAALDYLRALEAGIPVPRWV